MRVKHVKLSAVKINYNEDVFVLKQMYREVTVTENGTLLHILEDGTTGCSEASLRNCHYSLRNNTEERSALLCPSVRYEHDRHA